MNLRRTPISRSYKVKVGITMGDPSGIGPAIILKAIKWLGGLADFVVIGDKWVLNQVAGRRSQVADIDIVDLNNVSHRHFEFGRIKSEYGRASIGYLDRALELIKDGHIDCLVTAPISKEAINKAGFNYKGHTEYFSKHTQTKDLVMMLLNKQLKFALVTRHIPLKSVSSRLSKDKLYRTISLTLQSLKKMFLIQNPKIVVCGLNPHASDNGIIGNEENESIKPAVIKLKSKLKAHIDGPLPSDVAIYKANRGEYDCVIAMYHDQALIPLKLIGKDSGVNMTLGLPFVRTSPLHGTAFDIARIFPLASPDSLIEAIKLAVKCTSNQKKV